MGGHPVNLALRFLLEIAALLAIGNWGWQKFDGGLRYLLTVGIPLLAAVLWGTFRVNDDPGPAPVPVPGTLRLFLELGLFAFAVWSLADVQRTTLAWAFGIVALLHYLTSYDRVSWLISQRS